METARALEKEGLAARTDWATSIEASALVLVVMALGLVRHRLPRHVEVGEAILFAAAFLLTQGLVRDLFRLRSARAKAKSGATRVTCVCAESTIGLGSIVIGALLVFAPNVFVVRVPAIAWPIAAAIVGMIGLSLRSLVFDWKTRRVRIERDHATVVVLR